MSSENITNIVKAIHEQEVHKKILSEVHQELESGIPEDLLLEVQALIKKAEAKPENIVPFPSRNLQLGSTSLMAAAGQNLGDWFSQPLVFASSGMVIDIRKILGSEDEVSVYIHPNGNNSAEMEKTLEPFKDTTLHIKLSINGDELLRAEIYIDETGCNGEGTGYLKSKEENDVHGNIDLEIVVDE